MPDGKNGVQIPGDPVAAPAAPVAAPGETSVAGGPTGQINPAALTIAQAARLLGVAEQTIRDHVAAGLPTAADGTINLVHYAAYLNRELKALDAD